MISCVRVALLEAENDRRDDHCRRDEDDEDDADVEECRNSFAGGVIVDDFNKRRQIIGITDEIRIAADD